jgi:transcriptional regulator with XRE-family HTH domain
VTVDRLLHLGRLGVDSHPVALGEEIRRARELMGLTARELAEAVHVDPNTVSNWENNRTSPRGKLALIRQVLQMDDPEGASPGPPLQQASNAELLAEIARRLEEAPRGNPLPDVPRGRYRWSRDAAPSQRRTPNSDEAGKRSRRRP